MPDITSNHGEQRGDRGPAISEAGPLASLFSRTQTIERPASVRATVKKFAPSIRRYLDDGGSWDDLVAAIEEEVNRGRTAGDRKVVRRKSVETYVAEFCPAKATRVPAVAPEPLAFGQYTRAIAGTAAEAMRSPVPAIEGVGSLGGGGSAAPPRVGPDGGAGGATNPFMPRRPGAGHRS